MSGWETIIGGMMGFGASVVPDLITMLRDHFEHRRDIEKTNQTIEVVMKGCQCDCGTTNNTAVAAVEDSSELAERRQAYDEDTTNVPPFVTLLRSTVRPVVTYGFFGLFAVIKLSALFYAFAYEHAAVSQVLPILWDEDSVGLFAAVISFWFGSRALATLRTNRTVSTPRTVANDLTGHNEVPVQSEDA